MVRQGWKVLRRAAIWRAAALGLMLVGAAMAPTWAQTVAEANSSARVIVRYRADSPLLTRPVLAAKRSADRAQQLSLRLGHPLRGGVELSERQHVLHADGMSSAALAAQLAQHRDIEYAVPDQRRRLSAAPNDPRYAQGLGGLGPVSGQWYLRAPTSTLVSAIDAEGAWGVSLGSSSVVVAVLDTGVRYDHADLLAVASGGNLLPGYDMVSADGLSGSTYRYANDGDGRDADASDPGDWVAADEAGVGVFAGCSESRSSWHGTMTAGLIGALTDNSVGMASVGRSVRVLPVRVLGKCGGYDSDIIAGMRWAVGLPVPGVPLNPPSHRARVLNLSLGGDGACSQAYRDVLSELTALQAVVVVSAGNSAGHALGSPANCPGVVAVSGLRHSGSKVGFADLGSDVTISAPGGNCVNSTGSCLYPILTATNAGTTTPVSGSSAYTDGSNYSVGTSFSAPLVAGTVGLMLSAQPALTPLQVRQLLQATARSFPSTGGSAGVSQCTAPQYSAAGSAVDQLECYCTASTCGAGMLDAAVAVQRAASGPLAPGVRARIDLSPVQLVAGQAVSLSAAQSLVDEGRSITAYDWTLVSSGGIVSSIAQASAPVASLTPSDAGRFTVRLSVSDSAGDHDAVELTALVAAAPVSASAAASAAAEPGAPSSGGGGGGAASWLWQLGLLAGTAVLWFDEVRGRVRRLSAGRR